MGICFEIGRLKKIPICHKRITQVFRIDYENTFSPVVRFETLCLLLSLAVLHDWDIEALDVKTAFLFGKLDEEIYMEQPKGFIVKGKEKKVCRLGKAIYGLKQAVLQWNKQLLLRLDRVGTNVDSTDRGVALRVVL